MFGVVPSNLFPTHGGKENLQGAEVPSYTPSPRGLYHDRPSDGSLMVVYIATVLWEDLNSPDPRSESGVDRGSY